MALKKLNKKTLRKTASKSKRTHKTQRKTMRGGIRGFRGFRDLFGLKPKEDKIDVLVSFKDPPFNEELFDMTFPKIKLSKLKFHQFGTMIKENALFQQNACPSTIGTKKYLAYKNLNNYRFQFQVQINKIKYIYDPESTLADLNIYTHYTDVDKEYKPNQFIEKDGKKILKLECVISINHIPLHINNEDYCARHYNK
jgi:hypothetical protein